MSRGNRGKTFLFGNGKNSVCPGVSWTKSGMRCFYARNGFVDAVNLRLAHADLENMRYGLRATR